ncbi:hypothetical protein CHS0354_022290 [Potamilus streckersoni]|uniref:Uncharacterized protein n=1 Tax=Potamilus streckersoni TaxID=2493646 RepID=A0AAE0TH02_9BIVA|nr:hypothetical protein CHS0354_022290 [Potamilus streckersoni]
MRTRQMSIFYFFLFFLSLVAVVHGFCFSAPLIQDITGSKRVRYICEISQGDMKLKMLPGSIVYTSDCLECSCNLDTGLTCCGFGPLAGIVMPPEGCKTIKDGCELLIVDKLDERLSCNDRIPILDKVNGTVHPDSAFGLERNQVRLDGAASKSDIETGFLNQFQKSIPLLDHTSKSGWRRRIQSHSVMPISFFIPGVIFNQKMLYRTTFT